MLIFVVYLQLEGVGHTRRVKESEGKVEVCVMLRNVKKKNFNLSVYYTITVSVPQNQSQSKMKSYFFKEGII